MRRALLLAISAFAFPAQLRSAPADVVITDIIMPGIDGVTAIELIKRDFPGVKIVAISGRKLTSVQQEFLSKNVDLFLQKPFDMADLHSAVERLLA